MIEEINPEILHTAWEAYGAKMDAAAFAQDLVADVMLPGHGFGPRDSCGQYRLLGCLDNSHNPTVRRIKWSCHSRNCNTCWRSWCNQRAIATTRRLLAGVAHLHGPNVAAPRKRRILHMVVSVPPDSRDLFTTHDGRGKLRKEARARLARVVDGMDGGAIIDHGYRFEEDLKAAVFSPHFHFLCVGYFNMDLNTEIYEKEKGYIVKYLSSLATTKDLFSCVRYDLSHSTAALGEPGDRSTASHAVRYFGEFGYNKYKTDAILSQAVNTTFDILMTISSQFKKEDTIDSTRVTLMEIPHTYQHSTTVFDKHVADKDMPATINELVGVAGGRMSVQNQNRAIADELEDYPAKTKSSNICMVCGLTRAGEELEACRQRGHDVYTFEDVEVSQSPDDYLQAPPAGPDGTPVDPKWSPPPRYQIHVLVRYNHNKSKLIILSLDPSMDRICEKCHHIQQVLHYVGPPDPEFFANLPDAIIEVPHAHRTHFVTWAEFVTGGEGSQYVHLGIPYFDAAGAWHQDWGAYSYPTWRLPPMLHGAVCRHVLQSQLRARCAEHDEKYRRSILWDYIEHCGIPTVDGSLAPTDLLPPGTPVDLLRRYKENLKPIKTWNQEALF